MQRFRSGGLNLAFADVVPEGPQDGVMVLVHGFATSTEENWRRLGWLAALERKGRRAVALDLRGHGESDKPHDAAAYDRAAMAGDIAALMDHLGIGRADVMGYSLGAHLSLAFALSHPERVDHLILGGIGKRAEDESRFGGKMTMAEAMRAESADAIEDPTLKGFRRFAEAEKADLAALAACSEGAGRPIEVADLGRLATPTLVVAGTLDKIAGDPQGVADLIPGAKCVAIPGCDHFSAIPHALYKAAVFDFLEGWLEEFDP
jgi:pimeloyl-ACP methyl ester carboxylesterase